MPHQPGELIDVVDEGRKVDAVYLDFTKAFDTSLL